MDVSEVNFEIGILESSGDSPTCMSIERKTQQVFCPNRTGKSESLKRKSLLQLQTLGECENSDGNIIRLYVVRVLTTTFMPACQDGFLLRSK